MLSKGANRICREDFTLRETNAKFDYLLGIVWSEFLRMLKNPKGFRRNNVVY